MGVYATLGIYDYDRRKICDLYDSQNHLDGQAYDIQFIEEMKDGTQTLSFSIPYMIDSSKNFRWDYLKNEYLIRMTYGNRTEWFVASKPSRKKSQKEIIGVVNCNDLASLLKTRNIYMEFDDENGIGTAEYLMRQILKGTGWKLGDCDTIYESDGVTEKIRSLTSGGKTGARGLIGSVCNLFMCRPVYHSDPMKVDIISLNDRTQVLEGSVGNNLLSVNITKDSSDLITRLYVEGEYGDFGYVGIDDVNPTGLNYLFNFDYFREIGVFKQEHEDAYNTYIGQISNIVRQIRSNQELITGVEDELNTLIGQCQLVVYYRQSGFAEPKYIYGNPPTSKIPLVPRDKIMILQNDGKFRYATIVTSPETLMQDGDYAVAKFITPASGIIGGKEVQIEAKEQTIEQLEEKISLTTKEEKISEFNKEIGQLEAEISVILNGTSYSGQLENLAQYYVPAGYTGNVDLTNRIVIAGHRMNDAGWDSYESFDKGTLFPQTYTLSGTSQRYVASFTPVMTNGTVMTPDRLTAYVRDVEYEASHTGKTIAEADAEDLKLMLYCIDESTYSTIDTALVAMKQKVDKLKELQDSWDTVRARYDWFGYEYMDPDGMYDDAQGEAVDSLYSYVNSVMAEGGKLEILDGYVDIAEGLYARQNDVEATFIAAMGYLLRDGYWSDTNYATGQEEHLYQDALVHSEKMGQPEITCNVEYARINEKYGIPIQDIEMNAIFRVQDQDMNVYENLFVTKVVIGIDQENVGTINISNKDISMNTNDLGSLLSRISQLSDLVEQKNALYERAKAISKSGTFYADRLNGAIDVLTNQLKSTVSNWYTDEQGNIIFEAADGGSAMMLCGAGFMIAGSKKEDTGDWNWRTKTYHWFSPQRCGIITNRLNCWKPLRAL